MEFKAHKYPIEEPIDKLGSWHRQANICICNLMRIHTEASRRSLWLKPTDIPADKVFSCDGDLPPGFRFEVQRLIEHSAKALPVGGSPKRRHPREHDVADDTNAPQIRRVPILALYLQYRLSVSKIYHNHSHCELCKPFPHLQDPLNTVSSPAKLAFL